MKTAILPLLLFLMTSAHGQTAIGSVNAGATSSNNMAYSVGEIFVLPANPNQASSGQMGVLSYLSFFVVGVDETLTSDDFRVFPNPATHSVYFECPANQSFHRVFINDIHGKRVAEYADAPKSIDLSALANGIYIIQTDNSNIPPFKLIKR